MNTFALEQPFSKRERPGLLKGFVVATVFITRGTIGVPSFVNLAYHEKERPMNAQKNLHSGQHGSKREMRHGEMRSLRGGLPGLTALQRQTVTWKYIDATPQWAIDNALRVEHEIENIG